ncbi:hypothetical protein H7170_00110 [Candidatus Gracilibacteria bacterium]|nr:hypothetical protein [Candidatus Gracilibacteria bacterium]
MKFIFLGGMLMLAGTVFVGLFDIFFPLSFILAPGILILGHRMTYNW